MDTIKPEIDSTKKEMTLDITTGINQMLKQDLGQDMKQDMKGSTETIADSKVLGVEEKKSILQSSTVLGIVLTFIIAIKAPISQMVTQGQVDIDSIWFILETLATCLFSINGRIRVGDLK